MHALRLAVLLTIVIQAYPPVFPGLTRDPWWFELQRALVTEVPDQVRHDVVFNLLYRVELGVTFSFSA